MRVAAIIAGCAGAAILVPQSTARAQSAGETVEVTFTTEDMPLRLLVEERDRLYRLCDAPCELHLPAGAYQVHLQEPDRRPVPAGRLELWKPTHLEADYESRRAKRIGGGLWLAVGTVLGAYFLAAGGITMARYSDFEEIGIGQMAAGAVVLPVSLIGGSILVSRDDVARIHARPCSSAGRVGP